MEDKMDPELKAKWVAALRSDEFNQGTGALCSLKADGTKTHCCLGVLAHLRNDLREPDYNLREVHRAKSGGYDTAFRSAGLSDRDIDLLWHMNDGYSGPKHSFSEIADWIEKNL